MAKSKSHTNHNENKNAHLNDNRYTGCGVMKYYESGKAFAKDMGVPLETLEDTHLYNYEVAKQQQSDPGG